MYAASLALFRDIHSQMFLGLPLLFVVEAKRGSDFSRQEKKWTNCGGSEAEIQNWMQTEEGTRGTTVPLVPVLLTWFGNKFHFLHFFVDGPKSCPQI